MTEFFDAEPYLFAAYSVKETVENSYRMAQYIDHQGIEGDIVECGIAFGAQLAVMKKAAPARICWGYDSFEGIQLAGKEDEYQPGIGVALDPNREIPENRLVSSGITAHSLEVVYEKMNAWGFNAQTDFILVPGWVQNTIPTNKPKKIALLRLDMDIYDPTLFALEQLWTLMPKGAVLILDDWQLRGARQATIDFFVKIGYTPNWIETIPGNPGNSIGYLFK